MLLASQPAIAVGPSAGLRMAASIGSPARSKDVTHRPAVGHARAPRNATIALPNQIAAFAAPSRVRIKMRLASNPAWLLTDQIANRRLAIH